MKKNSTLFVLISLISVMAVVHGCKKATAPELTTVAVSEVTLTTAVSGGKITSDGGEDILQKGVCWSTTQSPTIASAKTEDGNGSAAYTSNLGDLAAGTTYYVRAYATNSVGTGYGNEVTFGTNEVTGAVLVTTEVTTVTSESAVAGGNITDAGGGNITARGICWGTSANPTIAGNKTTNGTGPGIFTGTLTGLTDGTTYYYRAYATNDFGTTYGQELHFITPVTDVEGNIYRTVIIGAEVWMAENLKVTKFNDNTDITLASDAAAWIGLTGPGFCWYNNDPDFNKPIYGALYNWYAASSANICPTGWHTATNDEYNALEVSLGLAQADINIWGWRGTDQGSKMKNTTGWNAGENGTNTSGFSALPGGYRFYNDGQYQGQNTLGYWWTATEHDADRGWYRRLDGNNTAVYMASTDKNAGKAIRCVKD
jgi:uncharacterized protein (TIGR02145 family)